MLAALSAVLALLLSGCAAGVAGVALALVDAADDSGGASDGPPVVTGVRVDNEQSRDRILIEFKISNDDKGSLGADVSYVRGERDAGGIFVERGPLAAATPAPGSHPLEGIPGGETVLFIWDAKHDLDDEAAWVRIVLTPSEDGKKGEPFQVGPLRAGNTPPRVIDLRLSANETVLTATFNVVDEEENNIDNSRFDKTPDPKDDLIRVELMAERLDEGIFHPIPINLISHEFFHSAPAAKGGAQGNFTLDLEDLRELRDLAGMPSRLASLGEPGTVDRLTLRLSLRDFPEEGFEDPLPQSPPYDYDFNDPPTVEVLPIPVDVLSSGIIPIHVRLFDPDRPTGTQAASGNLAHIEVEVDLTGDEQFQPAHEFLSKASSGTSSLTTLDPSAMGDARQPVETFLWDALSQIQQDLQLPRQVEIRLRGGDLEDSSYLRSIVEVNLASLEWRGVVCDVLEPYEMGAGDFDSDGFVDVLVLDENGAAPRVRTLSGSAAGLTGCGEERVEGGPRMLVTGRFNDDSHSDVVLTNYDSDSVTFLRGSSDGLGDARNIPTGGRSPKAIVSGRCNWDEFLDVVVANEGTGDVAFFPGSAGGPQNLGKLIPAGALPVALVCGDFSGDHDHDDVVVANAEDNSVTLLVGSTKGLRREHPNLRLSGEQPTALVQGQFGGDVYLDVVVANKTSNDVNLLLGSEFGLLENGRIPVGSAPSALSTGDFNGDNLLDVAVANRDSVVLLGGTGGGLELVAFVPLDISPSALAVGEFDGDGFPDVLVGGERSLVFLAGSRDGLLPTGEIPLGGQWKTMISGDFDSDGFLDVAVTVSLAPNRVAFLAGRGTGLVYSREIPVLGRSPVALAIGRFDTDSFPEVLVVNRDSSNLNLIRRFATGPIGVEKIETEGTGPEAVVSGDFDNDGFLDAVVSNSGSGDLTFLHGKADGLVPAKERIQVGSRPGAMAAAHLNRDEYLDAVVVNRDSRNVSFLRGYPVEPVLREESRIEVGENPRNIAVEDFDDDGNLDLAVANSGSGTVSFVKGSTEGPELRATPLRVGDGPRALVAGDFDADGIPDLAVASEGSREVAFLRGARTGLLPADARISIAGLPVNLLGGDFNGDGIRDVAVASDTPGRVTLLLGTPSGLVEVVDDPGIKVGRSPGPLGALDTDKDGFLDLLVASEGPPVRLTVLRGTRRGLVRMRDFSPGNAARPAAIAIGDLDGDGFDDVCVADEGNSTISFLRQRFLQKHVSWGFASDGKGISDRLLTDPRHPARYELQLGRNALPKGTPICMVPGPYFELPQQEFSDKEPPTYLEIVSDSVSLLREETSVDGSSDDLECALLTLRLRDDDPELRAEAHPANLHVFRRDPDTGKGEEVDVTVSLTDSGLKPPGTAVSFAIESFGDYVVAIERLRNAEKP